MLTLQARNGRGEIWEFVMIGVSPKIALGFSIFPYRAGT
jgi:hypothetical protein